MKKFISLSGLVILFAIGSTGALAETTDIPCMEIETVIASGDQEVWLFNLPDGSGQPFTAAQLADGTQVDASITITVMDCNFDPVAYFPAEDIWLESLDGGMIPCLGGSSADANTDAAGVTHWTQPLLACGASNANTHALVNCEPGNNAPMPLHFTSADISGDGTVNLADVGMFSSRFFGDYDSSADFWHDGQLNLADVGRLAQGLGVSCP